MWKVTTGKQKTLARFSLTIDRSQDEMASILVVGNARWFGGKLLAGMPTIRPTASAGYQSDEMAPPSVNAEFGGYFVCRGPSTVKRIELTVNLFWRHSPMAVHRNCRLSE
jgi:hypothetical protein